MLATELLPRVDEINAPYFEGAAQKRLSLQCCASCGKWIYYPRILCPYCQGRDLAWADASGRGRIQSFTVVHRPHHRCFEPEVPIAFVAVEVEEGPVMLSQMRAGLQTNISIGMPVQVEFKQISQRMFVPIWAPRD